MLALSYWESRKARQVELASAELKTETRLVGGLLLDHPCAVSCGRGMQVMWGLLFHFK